MCGNCSNGEVCDKVTGHCSSCSLGLEPPLCRSGIYNARAKAAEGTSETWVTVGASLGALVIMAIVVAAVVVCDRWEPSQSEAPTDQGEVTEIGSIPGEQSERPVTMQFPTEDAHDYLEIIPGPIYDQLQTSQDGRESHFYSALQTDQRSK
ncbi:uncharacterized protein [Littorina saxatilis]|uniref:uncharacterized protein n=1 Tax=Littorina saxatilis TaxID=31220 RepID=UPI0038B54F90